MEGDVPWYPESQLCLDRYKPGEDTQADAGGREDGENPDVELDFRPPVMFWGMAAWHCCVSGLLISRRVGLVFVAVDWWSSSNYCCEVLRLISMTLGRRCRCRSGYRAGI